MTTAPVLSKSAAAQALAARAEAAALRAIPDMKDPAGLRTLMQNARTRNAPAVYDAAFRRLANLVPEQEAGTLDFDFWKTTLAYEQVLTEKNGRATRATRLRQKVARVGVTRTLEDLATATTPSDGFDVLMARGMPELTAEAIILQHRARFSEVAVASAGRRLEASGADLTAYLPTPPEE
jgi:hypothetical protein